MNSERVRVSKFLSLVLRHEPECIGLSLDEAGWASIDELLRLAAAAGQEITRDVLLEIVATSDKQRFALSPDGERIRANQGHSISIDLGLAPVAPPRLLFHGTASRFLESILANGLRPGARQHVHLSADDATARRVGQRHGSPVVLRVDAAAMHAGGHAFYRSANGVWLTAAVPPRYLERCAEG